MKYIRTKEGIEAYNESCDLSYVYQNVGGIKIADTIEELVDEYVNEHIIFGKLDVKDILKYDKECLKEETIYGAIWTKWGLKYIAKINKEGRLELL